MSGPLSPSFSVSSACRWSAALAREAWSRNHVADQIRPLAINVNDIDRRARAGEPVSLDVGVRELMQLLREVRELLGDRRAG